MEKMCLNCKYWEGVQGSVGDCNNPDLGGNHYSWDSCEFWESKKDSPHARE
jgi:hypothetical protein